LIGVAVEVPFVPGPKARTVVEWRIAHASHTATDKAATARRIIFLHSERLRFETKWRSTRRRKTMRSTLQRH
jgi:hypothetical protein